MPLIATARTPQLSRPLDRPFGSLSFWSTHGDLGSKTEPVVITL